MVLNFIKKMFSGIGDFLYEFVISNSGLLVEEIGDIAYDVVERVENSNTDGDKFTAAKEALISELGERSSEYAEHILNEAIEIAVGILKKNGKEKKN